MFSEGVCEECKCEGGQVTCHEKTECLQFLQPLEVEVDGGFFNR